MWRCYINIEVFCWWVTKYCALLLCNKISHMEMSKAENYIFYLMGSKLHINGAIFKGDAISSVTISCNLGASSIKMTILYKWTTILQDSETVTCCAIAYKLRFYFRFFMLSQFIKLLLNRCVVFFYYKFIIQICLYKKALTYEREHSTISWHAVFPTWFLKHSRLTYTSVYMTQMNSSD